MDARIETVLQEKRVFPPSPAFIKQANVAGMEAYKKLVAEAERDFEGFWARLARETLAWSKPFTKVLDESKAPFFRWFYDGELNASYNCLDRHLKTQGDKTAIIFEADDGKVTKISYRELHREVCRFANALKGKGIKKGGGRLGAKPEHCLQRLHQPRGPSASGGIAEERDRARQR